MLASNMLEFRNYLRKNGILFSYSGYMTEDTLMGIGDAIKKKMTLDKTDKKTERAVFAVFVEQVQNVIRYSSERQGEEGDESLSYGLLTVGNMDGKVFITCGNMIAAKDVKRLDEALKSIQGMNRQELKTLWKETLRGETPEGSKGAGVGFIDIALKAQQGIEFDFTPVDDDKSFFTLKAYI